VAAIAAEVAQMAASGQIKPVIGASFPLADAGRAHEVLAGEHLGKIILLPGG
jgi:NADPH:quinone reductase-like Zn-dependent oxidoreductase